MKVHEIMTAHAHSVAPDTSLVEAAGLMRGMDVGALPVLDTERLAGIVTDRDIVVRGVADGNDPSSVRVSDVMSGGIESVYADDEVEEAARIMERHQIRRLPVLDRERRLVGMVSLGDIATSSNPAFSGLTLRDVSEPGAPSARRRRLERASESNLSPGGGRVGRAAAADDRPEAKRGGGRSNRRMGHSLSRQQSHRGKSAVAPSAANKRPASKRRGARTRR